jgi:hypothetical protein
MLHNPGVQRSKRLTQKVSQLQSLPNVFLTCIDSGKLHIYLIKTLFHDIVENYDPLLMLPGKPTSISVDEGE